MADKVEYEIDPPGKLSFDLREIWEYRELFYFFAWRDIKVKYKQTTLGVLWVVLQPLIMMLVFTFFLGSRLGYDSKDLPYPLFVLSGLVVWNIFSSGVNNASNSILTNAPILKKIYFPRLIIVFSAVLVSIFDFLVVFIIFLGTVVFYSPSVDLILAIACWPLAIFIIVIATSGLGGWLSALTLKYRDLRYVLPFALQIILFISPILYPVSLTNPIVAFLFKLNPLTIAVALFRAPFYGTFPEIELLAIGSGVSVILLLYGFYYFKKTELFFADLA